MGSVNPVRGQEEPLCVDIGFYDTGYPSITLRDEHGDRCLTVDYRGYVPNLHIAVPRRSNTDIELLREKGVIRSCNPVKTDFQGGEPVGVFSLTRRCVLEVFSAVTDHYSRVPYVDIDLVSLEGCSVRGLETTRPIKLHITGADMKNVSLGIVDPDAQAADWYDPAGLGFTVERKGVSTHYVIPNFLKKKVELGLHGLSNVAYMVLAVDKLNQVDPKFLIEDIIVDKEANYGKGFSSEKIHDWVVKFDNDPPIAAGDLHRFLKYQLMSYTVPHPEEGDAAQEPLLVPPSWVIL